jgi:hypothetical protein
MARLSNFLTTQRLILEKFILNLIKIDYKKP